LPALLQEPLKAFEKRELISKQRSGGSIGHRFPVASVSLFPRGICSNRSFWLQPA
jgi:hypothetical protein